MKYVKHWDDNEYESSNAAFQQELDKKCFNLNHFKCTHLSSTIWIVDIWRNEDKIIYVGIIGDGMGINQE